MAWELPTTVEIGGRTYAIRSDYRAVLDAIAALNDPALPPRWRVAACLAILYPEIGQIPDADEAFRAAMVFINLGQPVPAHQPVRPQLIHWDTDAQLIAPAVDKVLGFSCRRAAYLHWWEFIGAFRNIGRGLLAEVVSVRNKRARGKKLDKVEAEFARENAELIGTVTQTTPEEEAFFRALGV